MKLKEEIHDKSSQNLKQKIEEMKTNFKEQSENEFTLT